MSNCIYVSSAGHLTLRPTVPETLQCPGCTLQVELPINSHYIFNDQATYRVTSFEEWDDHDAGCTCCYNPHRWAFVFHHTKDGGHGRLYRGPMVIRKSCNRQDVEDMGDPVTADTIRSRIDNLLGKPSKACDLDQTDIEWLYQYSAQYNHNMEARRSTCQIL